MKIMWHPIRVFFSIHFSLKINKLWIEFYWPHFGLIYVCICGQRDNIIKKQQNKEKAIQKINGLKTTGDKELLVWKCVCASACDMCKIVNLVCK